MRQKLLFKSNVLVIVDLQSGFLPSNAPVVGAAAELARRSVAEGWEIVIVEFARNGKTHEEVLKASGDRYLLVQKDQDDGGKQVQKKLDGLEIEPGRILVCGVNLPWCVAKTACRLSRLYPEARVELSRKACDDYSSTRGQKDYNMAQTIKRINGGYYLWEVGGLKKNNNKVKVSKAA
jgi:nicotinamidase-related amidase